MKVRIGRLVLELRWGPKVGRLHINDAENNLYFSDGAGRTWQLKDGAWVEDA